MSAHVRWRADLALVFVCMVWGATFVLVKEALADISTLLFLAVRFTMAATALTLVFLGPMRRAGNRGQAVRGGAIAGVLLFSGYVLQTFGLKLTTATKTAFITALYIPLVPVFSALIHRRAPQAAESTGVLMAAVGMGLMTAHRNLLEVSAGDLLVAGCAVAFALHIVALGHFARAADTGTLAVTQIATCALLASALFWWAEPVRIRWSGRVWLALLVTSLLATALAFALQTWAQRFSSPTRTALLFSLEPVFAWVTSWLVAGETLTGRTLGGAALILTGILLAELKPFGKPTHPSVIGPETL
jgi:drug/metabolite transporter (DMT)-like permease